MTIRAFTFAVVVALLTGCVGRVSQIETFKRLIPAVGNDARLEKQRQAYAWVLTFAGAEIVVYPVEAQGRNVIFANGNGLRLIWDGESIIIMEGLPGAFGRYESGVEGAERWYARAGEPVIRASCTPRREWRLTTDRWGWRHDCAAQRQNVRLPSRHVVEYDRLGKIRLIDATIIPGLAPLRLQRVN